jgi:hypothetical protein
MFHYQVVDAVEAFCAKFHVGPVDWFDLELYGKGVLSTVLKSNRCVNI